ncbi:MAG: hypothetical protein LBK41_00045, partial [Clostridiales bacterium]|nr:hypothetical protein [Clostridiales bacterium]
AIFFIVSQKLAYSLSTRRFPLPRPAENHRGNPPIPLMNTGYAQQRCARLLATQSSGKSAAKMSRLVFKHALRLFQDYG